MKKKSRIYYKIFIKGLKWFYLFMIIGILLCVIIFFKVKIDGTCLWLKIWQG